jgi:phosphopantothenoylcysteine decarboxylase/phosphopantothenate--cysteine ligase
MGVAIAAEAATRGHEVTLLLGRGAVARPSVSLHAKPFDTTAELGSLLEASFPAADLLIMAAAVADFIPHAAPAGTKLSRLDGPCTLSLQPAPDLVAALASAKRPDQYIIGFALEPATDLHERASRKLVRKGLDAIVANPLETIESASVSAIFIDATGHTLAAPPNLPKAEFAAWLMDRAERLTAS